MFATYTVYLSIRFDQFLFVTLLLIMFLGFRFFRSICQILLICFPGSLPNCTTNIGPNGFICENDCRYPIEKIHSSCSIEYTGNIAPDMKWMTTSGHDTIQPQPITNVSEKTVSSVLNIEASESMNGASVVWYSTQSMQVKWTSAPIKILCQFKEQQLIAYCIQGVLFSSILWCIQHGKEA